MKTQTLILFLLVMSFFSFGQKIITIIGRVNDQNGLPIQNVNVSLLIIGGNNINTLTSFDGSFEFKNIQKENSFIIRGDKLGFLSKTITYHIDRKKIKKPIFVTFSLRERKIAIINTSLISDKDIGINVKEAIEKFKIDTTECTLQMEPPGISRGIEAELGDSIIIYLQFPRKANFHYCFKNILNEKITGIGLAFPNCSTKYYGNDFVWWGLKNPYCNKKE